MKRLLFVLFSCLATASAAAAQGPGMAYPSPGMGYPPQGMGYQPGYPGPGPGYAAGPEQGYPGQMPSPEMMGGQHGPEDAAKPSGWNPIFRRIFGSGCIACKKDKDKENTSHFKQKFAQPAPPQQPGGTLAFPHFQYVRSPRDWFMSD